MPRYIGLVPRIKAFFDVSNLMNKYIYKHNTLDQFLQVRHMRVRNRKYQALCMVYVVNIA